MNSNKFILTGSGSYDNKGCEAIIRGTTFILDHFWGEDNDLICESLFNDNEELESQIKLEYDKRIKHVNIIIKSRPLLKKIAPKSLLAKLLYKLKIYDVVVDIDKIKNEHPNILNNLPNCKAVLLVGGDNYTFDYGIPEKFIDTDDLVFHYKKPCILWGASVGPFSAMPEYEKYMTKHLNKLTAIFAREDVTVEYLDKIGVNKNVYRISDPAFLMEPTIPSDIDNISGLNESIGINISPLMSKYWANGDLTQWENFAIKLINSVIKKTNSPVVLIPHVVDSKSANNNDYIFLRSVKDKMQLPEDILRILKPDYSAAETKYLISQLKLLIAARTHATIAAFSTIVPTISLAYSIKAIGINKEVYGDLSYCLSKEFITNTDYIADLSYNMLVDSTSIKAKMQQNIVEIKQNSLKAGEILKELIN